ncbi:YitT family protein [Mesorhizobium sp. RP14(2022)]|uniref:YitT family protein n=1 Tax=Mesorhizobium liriopis TaxID=2953882 RepID=A0ABT1C5G7_9HYPH|nr:YitT family protein [Mesorhizobium liriopis]MCO6049460.1 YitT family protein [Mesorhizobium liriopis]
MTETTTTTQRHRLAEDVMAFLLGTLIAALGVTLYSEALLATGGTMGLSLLLQRITGWNFALVFFVINLPFYALSLLRMGWRTTLRTFIAVSLVSLFAKLTPSWIDVSTLDPIYAAIVGGGLTGVGLLMLFRHRASLGGLTILALYLQDRGVMRAGYFQLCIDALILLLACFVLRWDKVLLSLVGAAVLNLVIALNHRPGRYVAVS